MGQRSDKVLPHRAPRGTGHAGPPGCAVALGLVVALGGAWLSGGWAGCWTFPRGKDGLPPDVSGTLGLTFLLVGAGMIAGGLRRQARLARSAALLRRRPDEPWLADYAWNARGSRDESPGHIVGLVGAAAGLALFLAPFNWWAWLSPERNLFAQGIVLLFDCVAALCLWRAIYFALRWIRYGTPELRFLRFPFFLGGSVEAVFRVAADVRDIRALKLTLRCVEERMVRKENDTSLSIELREIWAEEWAVAPASGEVPVSVRIPDDAALESRLLRAAPVYWELEVTGERRGVDLGARMLVPVYAKRARS